MAKNTGAPPPRDDLEPVDLFEFLRSIEVAAHRKKITRMQERVARLTAMDSTGTSGAGVVVNVARTAAELGITTRSVWIHMRALVEAGWFVQTVTPTRGTGGSPGRRARYQCTRPPLDLGLISVDDLPAINESPDDPLPFQIPDAEPVDNANRVQSARSEPSDENASNRVKVSDIEPSSDSSTPAESCEGFGGNRMKVSAKSYEGAERGNFTLSASGGTPSDELPSTPVPQEPKPQDTRGAVDNRSVDKAGPAAWAGMMTKLRDAMTAAESTNPRHARPTPPPVVRPDRE